MSHQRRRAVEQTTDQVPTGQLDSQDAGPGNQELLDLLRAAGSPGALFARATQGAPQTLPYRARLEQAFGQSLGDIECFVGGEVELSSMGAMGASAQGQVVLPDPSPPFSVVAHEVAHVLQGRGTGRASAGDTLSAPQGAAEKDAEQAASDAESGRPVSVHATADPSTIHRYVSPLDLIDYASTAWGAAELGWTAATMPEGEEKDNAMAEQSFFLAIDLVCCAIPAFGGVGAAARVSRTALAKVWKALPDNVKRQIVERFAKLMKWEPGKADDFVRRMTSGGDDVPIPNAAKPDLKYSPKINGQMKKRGWDQQTIDDVVSNPKKTYKTKDTRHNSDGTQSDQSATVYFNANNEYVVVNDATGDIVQISNRNDLNWIAPPELP